MMTLQQPTDDLNADAHAEAKADAQANQDELDQLRRELGKVSNRQIKAACKQMAEIDKKRADLNAQATAIRATLREKGIAGDAFAAAYARHKMDAHDRAKLDLAVTRCNQALDVAYAQGSLFDANS